MNRGVLVKHGVLLSIIGIAVIGILLSGLFLRPFAALDADSLYWLRLTQQVKHDGFLVRDTGVVGDARPSFNMYPYILAAVPPFLSAHGYLVLNIFLALVTILLLSKLALPSKEIGIILLLISPVFIAHYTRPSDHALYFVFLLGYLVLSTSRYWIASVIPAFFVGLRSWADIGVLMLSAIVIWQLYRRRVAAIVTLILTLIIAGIRYIQSAHPFVYPQEHILDRLFVEFGQTGGISLVFALLAIVGTYHLWQNKEQFSIAILAIILFTGYVIINPAALFYLAIATVFLAAIAIQHLLTKEWDPAPLKIVFFALVSIIVVIGTIGALSPKEPLSQSVFSALLWLDNEEPGAIFTHSSLGDHVAYLSNKSVLLTSHPDTIPNAKERYLDSLHLFHTHDPKAARQVIAKYDINYIIITTEMRNGLVWDEDGKGLQYLVTILPEIILIYDDTETKIYRVLN